jgi:hypothetical protein
MMSSLPIALLALALTDSLPVPLIAVDGPQVAYTVAQYMDTTVSAWRILGDWQPEGIVETPGEGEVLVLFIPRAGEDQSTGVEALPPVSAEPPVTVPLRDGWCGRIFSIEWR